MIQHVTVMLHEQLYLPLQFPKSFGSFQQEFAVVSRFSIIITMPNHVSIKLSRSFFQPVDQVHHFLRFFFFVTVMPKRFIFSTVRSNASTLT